MNSPCKKNALLLGMVYSKDMNPSRGQPFRDRVRCEALETLGGFTVYTLDHQHPSSDGKEGRHCCTDFSNPRRMAIVMQETWGNALKFDLIIYFMMLIAPSQ